MRARWAIEAVQAGLRAYSQVLFARSWRVGALLLLATMLSPAVGLSGLVAVAVAHGFSRLAGLSAEATAEGVMGYNALLVGLGVGALLEPSPAAAALLVIAAATATLGTAAARSALGGAGLPALTLPFVLTLWLALGAAAALGVTRAPPLADPFAPAVGLPDVGVRLLRGLGALFFVPRADAGLLVLGALLIYSRYGALLLGIGLGLAGAMAVGLDPSQAILQQTLGFNMALTALAVGGVWFVPGPSALVAAAAAASMAGLLTLGAAPMLARLDLPVSVLPLNLVVLLTLLAARQRTRDVAPRSVDFLPGTPEENLHYYRTRVARFGAHYTTRFRAPFLGRWVVTQGERGEHTHKGLWYSALDFEVVGADGQRHAGSGARRQDWRCYGLPVLAAADGTVAVAVDGVPDNEPGGVDLEHNWGNLVVLYHGPGVYSLVAHLSSGSVAVQVGQFVRAGELLGRCGSSGRSPAPHLHFQLQAAATPGSPTLPVELHDVVLASPDGPETICGAAVPTEGQAVRNIEPDDALARLLDIRPGKRLRFVVEGQEQVVEASVDLLGQRLLKTARPAASLRYGVDGRLFTIYDALGSRRSVLHLLHMALPRLPFEAALIWTDHLPLRRFLPPAARWLLDPAQPFLPWDGLAVRYSARWEAGGLIVEGRSQREDRAGTPWVTTRAELAPGIGVRAVEVTVRGKRRRAERAAESPREAAQAGERAS